METSARDELIHQRCLARAMRRESERERGRLVAQKLRTRELWNRLEQRRARTTR